MRAPKRKRPQKRAIASGIPNDQLERLARAACYVGSPEHKTAPSFAGPMRPRPDATKCPTNLNDPEMLTGWLAEAIRSGNVSQSFDGDFPRYVWAVRDGGTVYEARITNAGKGEYKGYPLAPHERPKGMG